VPGGRVGAWIISLLCTAWAALATVALLYPGFGTSDPNSALPDGWSGQRGAYELSQFVPLAALIGLGLLFYALGAPTRRRQADLAIAEPTAPAGAAA
jgi:hypothetical protein